MLGLIKIGWMSAALSAGLVAALPVREALPRPVSGKPFVERLGEQASPTATAHIVSPLRDFETAINPRGDRRRAQTEMPRAPTVTIEQRREGLSVLTRLSSDEAALK